VACYPPRGIHLRLWLFSPAVAALEHRIIRSDQVTFGPTGVEDTVATLTET
jgi:hypothetical protein